jgi:hypothetical protein
MQPNELFMLYIRIYESMPAHSRNIQREDALARAAEHRHALRTFITTHFIDGWSLSWKIVHGHSCTWSCPEQATDVCCELLLWQRFEEFLIDNDCIATAVD